MTFHGSITAASPIALATAFLPPFLDRASDSAVVTIRKALAELPEEVRESTLEEISELAVIGARRWSASPSRLSGWAVDVAGCSIDPEAELVMPGVLVADITPLHDGSGQVGTSFLLVESGDEIEDAPEKLLLALRAANVSAAALDRPLTPEQIAVREKARDVIAIAERLLSPLMFERFLAWGERSSSFATQHETDEAGDFKCHLHHEGLRSIAELETSHLHDVAFKSYLLALELADASCFGPLIKEPNPQYTLDRMSVDFVQGSPLLAPLEELSRLAWQSDPDTFALSREIGAIVAAEFAAAQVGSRIEWDAALADYTSKLATCRGLDLNDDAGGKAVDIYSDAMDHLIENVPAPDLAALVTKIALAAERSEGFEGGFFEEHSRGIAADADRFVRDLGIDLANILQLGKPAPLAEWNRLMAEWRAACGEYNDVSRTHGEAEARYFEARPAEPAKPTIPEFGDLTNMTIAEVQALGAQTSPAFAKYEEQHTAWKAECAAVRVSTGLVEAEEAVSAALDRRNELVQALLAIPAPDHAYVFKKIKLVGNEYGQFDQAEMTAILADVDRLSGERSGAGELVH